MATKTAAPRKATAAKKTATPAKAAPAKAAPKTPAKRTTAPPAKTTPAKAAKARRGTPATEPTADEANVTPAKATRTRAAGKAAGQRTRATKPVENPQPPAPPTEAEIAELVKDADAAIAGGREARGKPGRRAAAAPAPREPEAKVSPKRGRSYVIHDVQEALGWIEEGLTYVQMSERHLEKYGRKVAPATFSLLRQRNEMTPRHVRNHSTIPWPLSAAHKHSRVATLLRSWERLRLGLTVSGPRQKMMYAWMKANELAQFTEDGLMLPLAENPGAKVVDYSHVDGFTYPNRRKSDEPDVIIRKPSKARIEELASALA